MEARNVPSGSFMGNQLQPLEGIPCPHCSPHPCQPPPTGCGKLPDQTLCAGVTGDQMGEHSNMMHEGPWQTSLTVQFVIVYGGIESNFVFKKMGMGSIFEMNCWL